MTDLEQAASIISALVRLVEAQATKGVQFAQEDLGAVLKPARDFLASLSATKREGS